jgi:hypothetical protein
VCIDEANWLCVSPRSRGEEEARRNHKFTFYGVSALCAVIAFVCLITGEAGGIINARKTEKPEKTFPCSSLLLVSSFAFVSELEHT